MYFDLLKARRKEGGRDVALVRIEQLYPFPGEEYAHVLRRYPNVREIVWCQEEPQNQGAWYQIRHRLQEFAGERREVLYAGRASAAAPATGLIKVHEVEQQGIVQTALHASAADAAVEEAAPAAAAPLRKSS